MPSPVRRLDFLAGATLLVDKPKGWTSFDVVNKLRYRLRSLLQVKKIKVGHAGTLDPMATGLLIICTGKFTKKLQEFQNLSKTYTGTLRLGASTPSYDAETEVDRNYPIDHIDRELLEEARLRFQGDLQQLPPMYSAIKLDGEPLYKKARRGLKLELKPRPVSIYRFELTNIQMPEIDFLVQCSKGTYIRSLVHDYGKALHSGAHLIRLCRTKIGPHSLENAWKLEDLIHQLG